MEREMNGEGDERKRRGDERRGVGGSGGGGGGVHIVKNSAPATGVQNGSPHL